MKNNMILFISKYRRGNESKEVIFKTEDIGDIKGKNTSDAPTRYYLKRLKKEGLNQILAIVSKEVRDSDDWKDYKQFVKEVCKEEDIDLIPEIIEIPYDYKVSNQGDICGIEKDISCIYRAIHEKVNPEDHIFIDFTGGLRDINLLLILLIRYLEFTGCSCEEITYANFQCKKIESVKYIYELIHLINGMDEFTMFGNVLSLKKYLNETGDAELNTSTTDLLDTMEEFSNIMSLCMVEKLDRVMERLSKLLVQPELSKIQDIRLNMFYSLTEQIRKKFHLPDESNKLTYIHILKWCLDNQLIQQALTIYVEKVPKLYFEHGIIEKRMLDTDEQGSPGVGKEANAFYKFHKFYSKKKSFDEKSEKELSDIWMKKISTLKEKSDFELDDALSTLVRMEKNKELKESFRKFQQYLQRNFSHNLSRRGNLEINGRIIETKKKNKFINQITGTDKIFAQYFIYGEEKNKKYSSENVYDKKIQYIMEVEKGASPRFYVIKSEKMASLQRYYFASKIFRNQINHANESDITEWQKGYFAKYNIALDMTVENIHSVLSKAINFNEQILEKGGK